MARRFPAQRGMTLVELMVSLALGLLLLVSFMSLYYSTRVSFTSLQERTLLQQNARFAFSELARDIRMAGSFGCANGAPLHNQGAASGPFYQFDSGTNGVAVYYGGSADGNVFSAADNVASGTPILKLQYARGNGVVTGGLNASSVTALTVQLPIQQAFDAAAPVLALASCNRVDVGALALSGGASGAYNLTLGGWTLPYSASGGGFDTHDNTLEAFQFITRYYYLKNASGTQGLYVKSLASGGAVLDTPVAERVTAWNVELGGIQQDASGNARIQYAASCAASGAVPCNAVGLVRLGLTLNSSAVLQADGGSKLVQRYNTTISLRNHGVQPRS